MTESQRKPRQYATDYVFKPSDDAEILRLRDVGYTWDAIGSELFGREKYGSTIRQRILRTVAARQERGA
jgi:hypothetical protein